MIFSTGKVKVRAQQVVSKLNAYASMKKLNPEQRIDFQDLQEELETLRRIEGLKKSDGE